QARVVGEVHQGAQVDRIRGKGQGQSPRAAADEKESGGGDREGEDRPGGGRSHGQTGKAGTRAAQSATRPLHGSRPAGRDHRLFQGTLLGRLVAYSGGGDGVLQTGHLHAAGPVEDAGKGQV